MSTPTEEGFRWPAEWERHRATWLAWPHEADTWPGCLEQAREEHAALVRALAEREAVRLCVEGDAMEAEARAALERAGVRLERVAFHRIPTDDAWLRDSGPLVLVRDDGERALADFRFDAWGGKYPPWDRDDDLPRRVAEALGLRRFPADFVLEGGSVDGDGRGTLLTTEPCLLDSRREEGRSRGVMEERLAAWLGARRVVWLPHGIEGDDTDGHVDEVARFVAPGTVVAAWERDPSDPNHEPLAENWRRLRDARDAEGRPLRVVALPMPPPQEGPQGRLPASYANFCFANGACLVPAFGAPSDDEALEVLRGLLPDREVAPVPSKALVRGLGSLHCLTQQEPEAPPAG